MSLDFISEEKEAQRLLLSLSKQGTSQPNPRIFFAKVPTADFTNLATGASDSPKVSLKNFEKKVSLRDFSASDRLAANFPDFQGTPR